DVEFEVPSTATDTDSDVRIAVPFATSYVELVNEEYFHTDLYAEIVRLSPTHTREFKVSTRQPGAYRIAAEFEINLDPRPREHDELRVEPLSTDDRSRYLREEEGLPVRSSPKVQEMLRRGIGQDATTGERLQWIFDFCSRDLRPAASGNPLADEVSNVLSDETPEGKPGLAASPLGRARTFATLCRAAHIPARLVTGFELRQEKQAQPHVWVEVYQSNRWLPFDPEYGYARRMPINFFPVRRGGDKLVREDETSSAAVTAEDYAIERLPPPEEVLQSEKRRPSQILDLTRWPIKVHEVMSLILLLPFGALITAVFRNIVGLRTFGTFAPALLAMSFIYSDWTTGLIVLVVVIIAGLVGRSFLERLHLLMVPRLSIILTTIILCVVFGVSLLDYLDATPGADAVLLPLVILTILIERFHVTREEDGAAFAGQLALGTLIVAAFCYLLLRWDDVGRLILIYPEAHLITIAVFILIGRYSGYRLSELLRFRDLAEKQRTQN
ncbi:MAG: 7TM domain-containing protein, partial [Planctomycetota bacterium]